MRQKIKIDYLKDYFFDELNETKITHLMIYLVTISVLEIFSYLFQGLFSILSSRLWLLGGIFCFISILAYFMKSMIEDIKDKRFISIFAIAILMISLLSLIGNINISEINPDATQQAAAGLNSFHSIDLNYTGKAFLGYPNRQYIIAAIPSFFFGRSIKTLQFGFAMPFLLGILLFYSALRIWIFKKGICRELAVLPLYALFVFPFITEYYLNFEQAIYPISFTMLIIGFFLLILINPSLFNVLLFAWCGCMLSNSYTPALATLGLMILFSGVVIYICMKKPELLPFSMKSPKVVAKALLLVELNVIVFFIATMIDKRQDRITQVRSDINLFHGTYHSIMDFLADKHARFLGMFGVVVIIYLLASLTYQLRFRDVIISLWIIGVFAATNLLAGYTAYQPAWIMQRALIIIPVFLIGLTLTMFDFLSKYAIKIKRGFIIIILITFALIGVHNFRQINQSFTYFNYIQPMKYMLLDLEKTLKKEELNPNGEFNLVLYTENVLMRNPADYCKFFYPNAKIYAPEEGGLPRDIDFDLNTYIYGDNDIYEGLSNERYDLLTFKNTKHQSVVYWYKRSILN